MNRRRLLSIMTAACIGLCCAGCGKTVKNNDSGTDSSKQTTSVSETSAVSSGTETSPTESSAAETTTLEKPEIMEQIIIGNYVSYEKYSSTKQAEDAKLKEPAKKSDEREGFKGEGYVTGLTAADQWKQEFDLPSEQYYNVSVCVASDKKIKTAICMDGQRLSEFTTSGNGHFELITVKNNYFKKGKHILSLEKADAGLDIDYCEVTASSEIANISFALDKPKLSNSASDYKTKALYSYICSKYGESVILGQHDTIGTTAETELTVGTTGRYPAIRFGDMMLATDESSFEAAQKELECAKKYAKDGGIIGYMWHWNAPSGKKGYYTEDTDFDLSKAVTKENIAVLPIEKIQELVKQKKVSEQCLALVKDIDTVSEKLAQLQQQGIPVIWRPLHEASNGYFWWGKNAEAYKWLWKLMFTRQTSYHKLNNLIWVWSAQNVNWYVGDSLCDIVSVDIYDKGNTGGNVNSLLFLQKISKKKPCAISECGNFPSIQSIADQKAMWSYIAQWGGEFMMKEDGTLSEDYNTKEQLQQMYNNNRTITRDKLPNFDELADQVKKQEEESKKTSTTAKKADDKKEKSTTAAQTTAAANE